ncbi:eukaryotic elongation factor 2 kinase-related [Anaeramoeba flamelloides]|uniref:Eukaryotic elongation factor 2 kinase-related n=1 Tax=Anaeramoeba flamelloides TaxID=1746091 RepID=A0AAV7ZXK0_9EUKA|nr:eukaryotic elongation factor 2 kinase-related [Anaeramoeba flamelloides]
MIIYDTEKQDEKIPNNEINKIEHVQPLHNYKACRTPDELENEIKLFEKNKQNKKNTKFFSAVYDVIKDFKKKENNLIIHFTNHTIFNKDSTTKKMVSAIKKMDKTFNYSILFPHPSKKNYKKKNLKNNKQIMLLKRVFENNKIQPDYIEKTEIWVLIQKIEDFDSKKTIGSLINDLYPEFSNKEWYPIADASVYYQNLKFFQNRCKNLEQAKKIIEKAKNNNETQSKQTKIRIGKKKLSNKLATEYFPLIDFRVHTPLMAKRIKILDTGIKIIFHNHISRLIIDIYTKLMESHKNAQSIAILPYFLYLNESFTEDIFIVHPYVQNFENAVISDTEKKIIQAIQHLSLEITNKSIFPTDFKKVGNKFLSPNLEIKQEFNEDRYAISQFFQKHKCNEFCQLLQLKQFKK